MKKIHRYLGLGLSLITLLISITGVMLVWKREYLWVTIPAARELPAQTSVLAQAAEKIESIYGPNEVLFVRFYSEGLSIHKAFLSDRRYAWHDQHGELVQVWQDNERFEDWLLDLHHRLLLGNTLGLNAVGFTGLLLIPLMLLGSWLWWPWRKAYRANIVPKSGGLKHLRKSHAETGISLIGPAMVIILAGVILVYPTQSRILLRDGLFDSKPPVTSASKIHNGTAKLSWQASFKLAQEQFPDGQLHWLSYPREGSSAFTIGVQESGSWNRMGSSSVRFSDEDTLIVKRQAEQSTNNKILDYTYPIHVGKFPTWYRMLLSATGVLIAWMSFLGLLTFFRRRR